MHNHFRLFHTSFGRSGPTCTSRGVVVTHPFEREDLCPHSGQIPTHCGAVAMCTMRLPSTVRCTDSTTTPSRSSSNELPWSMPAFLAVPDA